jgi:predicted NBD/HSP70 family sugar kinase
MSVARPTVSRIGNTQLISTLNNRLVLEAVRVMQPTFRADIARRTGLKPATVTSIVNDLLKQQLLREIAPAAVGAGPGAAPPGGRFGRPPLMLELNRDARRILAIDLEPDHLRVATTDMVGRIIHYREQNHNRFATPEATIADILKLSRAALGTVSRRPVLGVGVSLPGLIDTEQGMLLSSTNMPKWRDVPIGPMLEQALRIPVRVERSIHLAALYEKWVNPQHQDRTVVIISLRTGVGMSVLHRGQLYVGARGLSGEIGHTIVDLNGAPCECGSRGCLETFVSASAIVERARRLVRAGRGKALAKEARRPAGESGEGDGITTELIYRLARDGEPDCAEIVRDVGRHLGIAIANIINLLAPDEIVVAGAIDTAESLLLASIREQVNASALPRSREHVVVRAASETDKLPLLGAAVLIAQQLFELPVLRHADVETPA